MRQESNPPRLAVHLTEADLSALIRDAVRDVLAKTAAEPSDWIDSHGVAALLGIHPRSARKLRGLPCHRIGAKLIRYRRSEVLAWIEAQGRTVRR